MNMIRGICEKLHESAERLRKRGASGGHNDQERHDGIMCESAQLMDEAADTIDVMLSDLNASKVYTRRIATSRGSVGRCICETCKGYVEPVDRYCRNCGAVFIKTVYTRCDD